MRNLFLCTFLTSALFCTPLISCQQAAAPMAAHIALPAPLRTGGMSLNDALAHLVPVGHPK